MPDIKNNFTENDLLDFMVDYSNHHQDSIYGWRYLRTSTTGTYSQQNTTKLAEEQPDEVDTDWDEYV